MAKEEATLELNGGQAAVSKGLSYTKKDYECLVEDTMDLIRKAKKNQWGKEDVISLYGIFYSSMAGLLRSGSLASRDTGIDGFPEIHMIANDKEYRCRESALYGVLGDETDTLLCPYEDTFASYAGEHPFGRKPAIVTPSEAASTVRSAPEPTPAPKSVASGKKKGANAQPSADAFEMQKKQMEAAHLKETIALKDELKKAQSRITFLENQNKKEAETDRETESSAMAELSKEVENLTGKLDQKESECGRLSEAFRTMNETLDAERESAKAKETQMQAEIEKLKSSSSVSSEESYYNAMLPDLIRSIEGTNRDLAVKIALLALSFGGILFSFLFLI